MVGVRNKTGISFSIWIDKKSLLLSRANYNIHALRLGRLQDYALTSRAFGDRFQKQFASHHAHCPTFARTSAHSLLCKAWLAIASSSFDNDRSSTACSRRIASNACCGMPRPSAFSLRICIPSSTAINGGTRYAFQPSNLVACLPAASIPHHAARPSSQRHSFR